MTTPTISAIVTALQTAIESVAGDWERSTKPYESFFDGPTERLTRSYAIAAPRTRVTDPRRRVKTRPSTEPGMLVETTVRARFAWRLRLDGTSTDLHAAYVEEQALLQAAASVAVSGIGPVNLSDLTRTTRDEKWALLEVEWRCAHVYAVADPDDVYTPPGGGPGGVRVVLGDGVVNDPEGTANVNFATPSGAEVNGSNEVVANLANGSVQINGGTDEVEAVVLDGATDTGSGVGPNLANSSVEVSGGAVQAVVLDGATDTGSGVGPNLSNNSVEVSGGAVQAVVLDGATDTGSGVGPALRSGDPLEVVGGEVQVDQTAVLGTGGVSWNDTTRAVDASAAPFALQDYTSTDVLAIVRQNLSADPTITDQPGRLRISWTQNGRTDGDGETAVIILQPKDKDGNNVDDLHLRQQSVQLRARWSLVGAGAISGVSGDPICRVGLVAINRTGDWVATAIDHSCSVGVVGSSTSAGLARTASSGASAGDGTNTQPGVNGVDATFAPFDPVYGDLGFGTLTYTTTDGTNGLEANSQEASGNVSNTSYRWAIAIFVGNSLAVSGGTNTVDVDLDAVAFQSHA
jgi:hypothetical protein